MESIVKMGTNDRRRERICRAYETLVDVLRSLKVLLVLSYNLLLNVVLL